MKINKQYYQVNNFLKIIGASLLLLSGIVLKAQEANFYHDLYDQLHDSPTQQNFRKINPLPAGVVYIQHPGEGEAEIREHFRMMRSLGFNSLKQIMTIPGWTLEDIQLIALEEGLIPWWYGQGGWETITDELLRKLKIPIDADAKTIREHPEMVKYQTGVLRKRILRLKEYREMHGDIPKGGATAFDPTVGDRGLDLTEAGEQLFTQWVKDEYKSIENLNEHWTLFHVGTGTPFESWDDFNKNWKEKVAHRNFKQKMDVFRFKAEHGVKNIAERCEILEEFDSDEPFRGGGEMSLFLPAAWYGVDMEKIADVVKDYGSFYPSMHLSWHFNLTNNEVVRPFYMQSSMMNDFFKGGWTGGWESSGGPQQFDGNKNASETNAYYFDDGTVLQLFMSQMAAGFKGFGVWCWSVRSAGKEGGDYALLDRNNQVTERARQLGLMAKAMERYRDEIWDAHKEPVVGVLLDWNNDAAWAAMSVRLRDDYRHYPIQARIGAARALMNANIPFEFVTSDDLKNGLAKRYQAIYLPSIIAMDREVFSILEKYTSDGGRIIMDLPGGKFDENTQLLPTGMGSTYEKLFGATLDNFQFSGSNKTVELAGRPWTGYIADFSVTKGKVMNEYSTGDPGIIENSYGKGSAVLIGLDLGRQCMAPGNELAEEILVSTALGEKLSSPYQCEGALVYRLSSPSADHYYFINDGVKKIVSFSSQFKYKSAADALTGEVVDLERISLRDDGARWIRMEK